jgi:hypothetical protein
VIDDQDTRDHYKWVEDRVNDALRFLCEGEDAIIAEKPVLAGLKFSRARMVLASLSPRVNRWTNGANDDAF